MSGWLGLPLFLDLSYNMFFSLQERVQVDRHCVVFINGNLYSTLMLLYRRKIHVFEKVVILMRKKMMIVSGVLRQFHKPLHELDLEVCSLHSMLHNESLPSVVQNITG